MKKIIIILTLFTLVCSNLFSQSVAAGKKRNSQLTVTINCNVPSYTVWVDNQPISGNQANVTKGVHRFKVTANGYTDWTQDINITQSKVFNVTLLSSQHRLSIQTNTASSIYINNRMVGNNSYSGALDPGTYTIVVRSNGFMDYRATVVLDRDTNLVANLQPLTASVSIFIPPEMLNDRIGGAINQVKIYDNGKKLKGYNFQLTPGNHTIRIESGGFAIEGNYNFEAGRTYNIEPVMYMNVK